MAVRGRNLTSVPKWIHQPRNPQNALQNTPLGNPLVSGAVSPELFEPSKHVLVASGRSIEREPQENDRRLRLTTSLR